MISKTALVSQQQKLPYSGFSHIREWACHAPAKRSIKCLDLDAEQIGVILFTNSRLPNARLRSELYHILPITVNHIKTDR